MTENMDRRAFMKRSAVLSASALAGGSLLTQCGQNAQKTAKKVKDVGVSVVQGSDYFQNTLKAVEQLGGMGQFVPKGSKVAILANPQRNNPGVFTKPQVLKAAIHMCKEAGAEEVACISQLPEQNWDACGLKAVVHEEGATLVIVDREDASQFRVVPIPNGVALKEAQIMNALYDYDVFIDMPITKDHAGNRFTGTMKNMMGLNGRQSNRTFHKQNWTEDSSAIDHLEQCIADLNTIVTPDLCIVDATEFVTTNGPFGPGEIITPQKVVAGTDRVAIDAYCCTLWGLKGEEILQIKKAFAHELGEIDLQKVKVMEAIV